MPQILPGFSHTEYSAAYAGAQPSHPSWRFVAVESANVREYVARQIVFTQFAYFGSVVLLLLLQLAQPTLDDATLRYWCIESVTNLALRGSLFAWFFTRPPQLVASHRAVQLIPMFNVLVVAAHWVWTALLFVDPAWTYGTFATLLVFILMSVSTMPYGPSPVPTIVYWLSMWMPAAFRLWPADRAQTTTFALLMVVLVGVLGTCAYLTQVQVRRHLNKADEVDALVNELRSKNEELSRLRHEANERLHERSAFFNGASHDFGQRLHAMKLLTNSALTAAEGRSQSLQVLSHAVSELEDYVRDVLEFARIESRVVTPNYSTFHLQDVFQALAVQFDSIADGRGVELRFRTSSAVVHTDQGILTRVLENLIGNALKFTTGGVLVAARVRAAALSVEIWDQGPGIPAASLDAIFASFYQDRVYADRQRIGVGLGLAIVKRLADGLDYKLQVRSREGHGSVFKVIVNRAI